MYYSILQHDETDCGAACIATIAKQHGLSLTISKIREIAGTDKKGTSAYGLVVAAQQLGFSAKGVKAEREHLTKELPLPCIAHVVKDGYLHYVVIHKITKKKLIVADPAKGIEKYTFDDFMKIWSGVLIFLEPAETFEKGDETKGLFARFFHILLPYKALLMKIFIASILYTVLGLIGAFYFKMLVDDILVDKLTSALHIVSIGIIVLTIFKIMLGAFRQHMLVYLGQKIDITMILNYYTHVLRLPMSFFDSRKTGEILSRLQDATKIRAAISGATLTVMIDSLMAVCGALFLYFQNATLFLIAVLAMPLYALVVWIFKGMYKKLNRTVMAEGAELQSYLVESINGAATVKAMNAEDEALQATETRFIKMIKTGFKLAMASITHSALLQAIAMIGGTVILWVGSTYVINGNISIGQLITFNALLAYFWDPMKNLINLQASLQEAGVAAERLGEIQDLEIEQKDEERKIKPAALRGDIVFRDVDFRYGTRQLVLKNINLTLRAGEKIAIVGESGGGKTTLVKLLLRFYEPEKGEVTIDGYNVKDINLEALRDAIGYVPQDVLLFSGSVRDNIAFGHGDVPFEEIIEAAKKANAHEFINEMYGRYDTPVGERGASVSGGQKQRIAIARALLKNPRILILDEATSSLDTMAERAIHTTIDEVSKDITTIIIAHRLSTVRKCDRIVVVEKGEIVEVGNHAELLAYNGRYAALWNAQIDDDVVRSVEG